LKNGRTVLTLAPERVPYETIRELTERGVVVCAGHTAATFDETRAGLDAGIRGFTHLYNAMSPLTSREPGAVGAALEDRDAWCGIVVDGFHVHPAALRIALAAKPRGKLFLVTDAMPPVGGESATYTLGGVTITCRDGRCVTPDGVIAGSALDMAAAIRNSVATLGVDLAEAVRMASTYPADFLGLSTHGRIAPGAVANLVVLDRALRVRETI
jgi:N-acetylglucosamine-6-phosphate deacetylase